MKYLVYFRPNVELSDLILRQKNLKLSDSGLHATLCSFYMIGEVDTELIEDLSQIDFRNFEIETLCFDDFAKNSFVLRLSRSDELLQLHKRIVAAVRTY